MVTLENVPPEARADAVAAIRALQPGEEVPTALRVMVDMICVWRAAPQDAADLVAALFKEARGTA